MLLAFPYRGEAVSFLQKADYISLPVDLSGTASADASTSDLSVDESDIRPSSGGAVNSSWASFAQSARSLRGTLAGGILKGISVPDVFNDPRFSPKEIFDGILKEKADWAILAGAVVVLLILDAFVLQPLSGRFEESHGQAEQVAISKASEASLKQAFDRCAANGKGGASKEDLISACKGLIVEPQVRKLPVAEGAAVSWEEFRGVCRPESQSATMPRPGSGAVGHLVVLVFWVLMGFVFNGVVWYRRGQEDAFHWLTGYVLEWLLSLDNIFIFCLIFRTYSTPRVLLHKALFLGILGAVVFRMMFFMVLTYLLHMVQWVRFVFGILLIYSGVQAARDDDGEEDVSNTVAVQLFKRCLGSRLLESYDLRGHSLFVRGEDGRLRATLLVLVIVCLEFTDIFFAIDSVSAKVAQIPDYYIAYSSSVIAIFGLRAMFFVVQDMVDSFDLMKYGLCLILVFIGIELMISDWVQLPAHVVCVVIVSVFAVGVAGSVAQQWMSSNKERSMERENPEDDHPSAQSDSFQVGGHTAIGRA